MSADIWARVDEAIDTDPLQLRDIVAELLARAEKAEAKLAATKAAFERAWEVHGEICSERELAEARAAIERAREGLGAALTVWEPEHEYHQDRAQRKGYTHNQVATEVYGDAIKAVTDVIAALDAPESPADVQETTE
jgi:hypothetical protein